MYGDTDLAYLVGHDFGVPVVYGTKTATWQLDEKSDEPLHGHASGVSAVQFSIFGPTGNLDGGSLGALAIGNPITVNGVSYVIRNVEVEDMSTTRVRLRK